MLLRALVPRVLLRALVPTVLVRVLFGLDQHRIVEKPRLQLLIKLTLQKLLLVRGLKSFPKPGQACRPKGKFAEVGGTGSVLSLHGGRSKKEHEETGSG